jgi:hypothetical protein
LGFNGCAGFLDCGAGYYWYDIERENYSGEAGTQPVKYLESYSTSLIPITKSVAPTPEIANPNSHNQTRGCGHTQNFVSSSASDVREHHYSIANGVIRSGMSELGLMSGRKA